MSSSQPIFGLPKGTTIKKQKLAEIAVMGAKNLIAELYEKELRRAAEKGRNVKRETLAKFVKEVMDNNNITGTKGIKNNAIKQ